LALRHFGGRLYSGIVSISASIVGFCHGKTSNQIAIDRTLAGASLASQGAGDAFDQGHHGIWGIGSGSGVGLTRSTGQADPQAVPGKVKRGPFTYDRKLELQRIARA
jgi:hypothetical protein